MDYEAWSMLRQRFAEAAAALRELERHVGQMAALVERNDPAITRTGTLEGAGTSPDDARQLADAVMGVTGEGRVYGSGKPRDARREGR